MNSRITSQKSGGRIYNTVYLADFSQNSAQGTADVSYTLRRSGRGHRSETDGRAGSAQIVNQIQTRLAANPSECFLLQGYSQGAAATVNALPRLTGSAFDAVKGVFLIGDPLHKSGLACNVDNHGGSTTRNVNGLSAFLGSGISSNWVAKTADVCIYGDGVCDTTHGYGINAQHLQYPYDTDTQNMGATFGLKVLA